MENRGIFMENSISFESALEKFKEGLNSYNSIENLDEMRDFIYFLKMSHKSFLNTYPKEYQNLLRNIGFTPKYREIVAQTKDFSKMIDSFEMENSHIFITINNKELIFPQRNIKDIIKKFFWLREDFIYYLLLGILSQEEFFSTMQLYCIFISLSDQT